MNQCQTNVKSTKCTLVAQKVQPEVALTWVLNSDDIKSGHAGKTQLRLANFRAFKITGEERIYGRKDLLLSNFQKPGSHPFLSITLFATMSSQTPS